MSSLELEVSMIKQQVAADFKDVSDHINRLYEVIGKQFTVIQSLDARLDVLEAARTESKQAARTGGIEL